MRITRKFLEQVLQGINTVTGKKWVLDYNTYYGYKIIEQVNESGGYKDISNRMTSKEMCCYLMGIEIARRENLF